VSAPQLVFGVPLYGAHEHMREALESLLAQRDVECAVVCVDDDPGGSGEAIVAQLAAGDRLQYTRNPGRLGLTANWRRAFEVAVAAHPGAAMFAWASDHDVWHPEFAARLVRALERRPDAVLAYPRDAVIGAHGELRRRHPSIDTSGIGSGAVLQWRLARRMRAGQMVYGVARVRALRRSGVFRDVLFPDRLLLTELALDGALIEVPEVLWYKRKTAEFSVERQRETLFGGRRPAAARLPWWLVHTGVLAREHGIADAAAFAAANASRTAASLLPWR
jgi:glycosyltransferase involved in cell wall biosynthesis